MAIRWIIFLTLGWNWYSWGLRSLSEVYPRCWFVWLENFILSTHNRSDEYYFRYFTHLLEVALINTHILYQIVTGKKIKSEEFRKIIIKKLFEG